MLNSKCQLIVHLLSLKQSRNDLPIIPANDVIQKIKWRGKESVLYMYFFLGENVSNFLNREEPGSIFFGFSQLSDPENEL